MTGIGAEAVNGVACSLPYFMGIDTPETRISSRPCGRSSARTCW